MDPFFSIIIPVLNEEKHLPFLLKDLANQTCLSFEVIVVDGMSEDKTIEKIQTFKTNFRGFRIESTSKRNVSFQRNLGAKKAKGAWLIFMDADNRLPDFFLDGVKYRIALLKPDLFTTWCDPDGDHPGDKLITQGINAVLGLSEFIDKPVAWGAMIGITKKGFKETRGFDVKHIPFEDKKFVSEAFKKGLSFAAFRDPKYIFSTRRFREEGRLIMVQKYIELNVKDMIEPETTQEEKYPMGGHVFRRKHRR